MRYLRKLETFEKSLKNIQLQWRNPAGKFLDKFDKIAGDYWENMKCEFKTPGKFYENKKKRSREL